MLKFIYHQCVIERREYVVITIDNQIIIIIITRKKITLSTMKKLILI